jgi:hypothetical protein
MPSLAAIAKIDFPDKVSQQEVKEGASMAMGSWHPWVPDFRASLSYFKCKTIRWLSFFSYSSFVFFGLENCFYPQEMLNGCWSVVLLNMVAGTIH